jgi:RluA family pseudouridine synthase
MKLQKPDIPKKYRPTGFHFLHEDLDLIAVNKQAGLLSVSALWNEHDTVLSKLNTYVQKGNPRSNKTAYVVHRLDQATSGVLVFAKSEKVQNFLKDNWADNEKIYYTIVEGQLKKTSGLIESYLQEDENYVVHSSQDNSQGKLARTEYSVVNENARYSLIKINLLTGKKNQIRVHMSELGHPIVDDIKYGARGKEKKPGHPIMLHSYSLELTHPFKKERVKFVANVPRYFHELIDCSSVK